MTWTRNELNTCFLLSALHFHFLLSIFTFCYLVTAFHGCIICMIVLVSNMFTLCAAGGKSQYGIIRIEVSYQPCALSFYIHAVKQVKTKAVGTILLSSLALPCRVGAHRGPTEYKIRTSTLAPGNPGTHRFRARKRTTPKIPSNSHPAKSFTKKVTSRPTLY